MTKNLRLEEVEDLSFRVLTNNGVIDGAARILAGRVMAAERDGPPSHGLAMLPLYVSTLSCGWVSGSAEPCCETLAPSVLSVDGDNGFAPVALAQFQDEFVNIVRQTGIATMCLHNVHHISALRADIEPLAELGLVVITCITSRCWMVPWGGRRKILGTNPMAFACPRQSEPPIVWDQASSVVALSDIRLAAEGGEIFDQVVGLDLAGEPTADARLTMETETLLSFGQHKGTAIALMVEILAGALTRGNFSVEDRSVDVAGAASGNGGQMVIGIDPAATFGEGFCTRLEPLLSAFDANGTARIPGDGRLKRRDTANRNGVSVRMELWEKLQMLARPQKV